MTRHKNAARQGGGFAIGLVVGVLVGLALALGVALYITKVPVPFIDKVPQRSAAQEQAEAERLRHWDPNAPLGGRIAPRPPAPSLPESALPPGIAPAPAPAPGVVLPPAAPPAVAQPGARDPAAILSGSAPATDAYLYFVQAGAYTRADEAEQQRARLALMGMESRITEREQSGRTVYRVRVGPYPSREQADGLQMQLTQGGVEAQIVRVERP